MFFKKNIPDSSLECLLVVSVCLANFGLIIVIVAQVGVRIFSQRAQPLHSCDLINMLKCLLCSLDE